MQSRGPRRFTELTVDKSAASSPPERRSRARSRRRRDDNRSYVPSPAPSPHPSPLPSPNPRDRDRPRPRHPGSRSRSGSPKPRKDDKGGKGGGGGDAGRARRRKNADTPPQKSLDRFWERFVHGQTAGKTWRVLPGGILSRIVPGGGGATAPEPPSRQPTGDAGTQQRQRRRRRDDGSLPPAERTVGGQNAVASYEEAAAACRAKVGKIVRECRRVNQKYRDAHFDIEADLATAVAGGVADSLVALGQEEQRGSLRPMSVKRVEDIFEDPHFFIEGATANDVRQGNDGDCWFMSALCTLSNKDGLIQRVCVARDEQVGVYGFVFHRDGEWISEVIDDKLYLIKEDFHEAIAGRYQWLELQNRQSPEDEYRKVMQTGSRALYFAQCRDSNETWLPLLEKAYAKAHGDFAAIEGGFVGEGIEDLTGGVTTELFATDILDKEKFWKEELMLVNENFLFGCGQMGGMYGTRQGILEKHAYSIMEAAELDGERLLKLRNPWGKTEWTGPWSDGSEEWTPERMQKLNHRFGDDGVFWISYRDLLRHYQHFDRTRLFGPEWTVTQQWSSVDVPWSIDYLDTKFRIKLSQSGPVVLVLAQLDTRYFRGLEGEYDYELQMLVAPASTPSFTTDYIVRSNRNYFMRRSVSLELPHLDAGTYDVHLKITATRYADPTPEEVVRASLERRRAKLLTIGLSYDCAHAKGGFAELEREQRLRARQRRRDQLRARARRMHDARRRQRRKDKLRTLRREARLQERAVRHTAAASAQDQQDAAEAVRGVDRRLEELKLEEEDLTGGGDVRGRQDGSAGRPSPAPRAATGAGEGTPSRPGHTRTASLPISNWTPNSNPYATPTTRATEPSRSPGPRRATSPFPPAPPPAVRRDTLSPNVLPGIRVSGSPKRANGLGMTSGGGGGGIGGGSSAVSVMSLSEVSDDDASFDSEIDAPSSEDVDEEEEMMGVRGRRAPMGLGFLEGPSGRGGKGGDDESEDEDEPDPWNAVCVLGLRVYSTNAEVEIEVIRPGSERKRKEVDVDDAEADAVQRGREGDVNGV